MNVKFSRKRLETLLDIIRDIEETHQYWAVITTDDLFRTFYPQ